MAEREYLTCIKAPRLISAGNDLVVGMWDIEWTEFAVLAPRESSWTYRKLHRHVSKTMRANGYGVNWLQEPLEMEWGCNQFGISFRYWKLEPKHMPKQKPMDVRPFEPPEEMKQPALQLA